MIHTPHLLPTSYDIANYWHQCPPKRMVAREGFLKVPEKGGMELNAEPCRFVSLCSLLQGAIGEEPHVRAACLSYVPSKLEEDPTLEPPVSTALAAGVPSSGIQFCLLPLLVIKSASPCIP